MTDDHLRDVTKIDPTATDRGFVLWHRTGSRGKWREVGSAPSQIRALALIDTTGKVGGDWLCLPSGKNPNDMAAA